MFEGGEIQIDQETLEAIKRELKKKYEPEYGTLAQIYPAAHTLLDDLDDPQKVLELALKEGIITIEEEQKL